MTRDLLTLVGLLGPVRKLRPLTYRATCPACRQHGLTVTLTPAGDRPSCQHCPSSEVVRALRALDRAEHTSPLGSSDPDGRGQQSMAMEIR